MSMFEAERQWINKQNSDTLFFRILKDYKVEAYEQNKAVECIVFISCFPGSSDGKESINNGGDSGLTPGSGRSPGEGNGYPLQYSCLENSMDRGAWQSTAHGVARSQTQLSDFHGNNDDNLCMISNFPGFAKCFCMYHLFRIKLAIWCWTNWKRRMRKTGQKIIKINCCCCSVTKSGWTVCNPTDCRMPGFPVQSLLKFMSIESTEHIAGKCGYSVILTNQSVLFLHLHVKFKVINYEWGETALWGQKGQYQEVKEHEWRKRCSERPRATWGSFGVGNKPLYSWKPSVESQYYSKHD